jgi:hypothetical protein
MRLEQVSVGWLKELFGLPAGSSGVLTNGATMGELDRSRGRPPLLGVAARRRRGAGALRAAAEFGAYKRQRARERGQGAREAGHRQAAGSDLRGGRLGQTRRRRAGGCAAAARGLAAILVPTARRGERGWVRLARPHGRPSRRIRRLAARGRRLRALRGRPPAT